MKRTNFDVFTDLFNANGYVTNAMLEEAGVKYPSSYTTSWQREVPPRIVQTNNRKPYRYALPQAAVKPAIEATPPPLPDVDLDSVLFKLDDAPAVLDGTGHVAPGPTPAKPAPELPVYTPDINVLISQVADHIAAQIAHQVRLRLQDYLIQAVPEDLPVSEEEAVTPPPVRKAKGDRLHVCIAGLLPQQAQIINNEFGKDMRLSFIHSNANPKDAKGLLAHADAALIMTKFVGHWLDGVVSKAGIPVQRITGGMSRLRDSLTSLYCTA
ncbi:MAG: hypothetical protein KGZ68_04625 [Dechloromonas sp.]|nr:hypothetical protein [Dechloromonas sp.]